MTDNSYGFFSIAHDGAGLVQSTPTSANTTTLVAVPPFAATLAATNIGTTSATFTALVNPNGSTTSLYFEWGTTADYGNFSDTNTIEKP